MQNLKKYFSASYHQPYPKVLWLMPLLLITVHCFIVFEEKPSLKVIMTNRGYYRALLFSLGVAALLVYWVRAKSIKLDTLLPWQANFGRRLKRQLLLGLVFPLLLALCLATCYFAFLKINIIDTVYFTRYLPMMAVLLLLLNTLAFGWNQYFRRNSYVRNKRTVAELQVAGHLLANHIACVYVANGVCKYHTANGEHFAWTGTFETAVQQLEPAFFLIRRGVLVNRNAIVAVLPEGKLLKVVLAFEVPVSLVLSYRKLAEFKRWLAEGQAIK